MGSASVSTFSYLPQFPGLVFLSGGLCLGHVKKKSPNPYFSKLLLGMVFITAIDSKLKQSPLLYFTLSVLFRDIKFLYSNFIKAGSSVLLFLIFLVTVFFFFLFLCLFAHLNFECISQAKKIG